MHKYFKKQIPLVASHPFKEQLNFSDDKTCTIKDIMQKSENIFDEPDRNEK